jgi:hypothetical protein
MLFLMVRLTVVFYTEKVCFELPCTSWNEHLQMSTWQEMQILLNMFAEYLCLHLHVVIIRAMLKCIIRQFDTKNSSGMFLFPFSI